MAGITRRRFIGSLAALLGLGGVGLIGLRRETPPSTTTTAQAASPTTTASTTTSTTTTSTAATTTATTAAAPETTVAPTTTSPPADALAVICKESWGALPVAGVFRTHTIERITVHHTAVVLERNSDAPARVRQHQEFHQSRGWPDLAYHFIIDAAGNVYQGRPVEAVGDTGTDYDPTGHFLVCCEGDFNQQVITPEQYDSLVRMLSWGAAEFDVGVDTIVGHRDVASTSCPGDTLYELIGDGRLQGDVAATPAPVLTELCGDAGDEAVAAISSSA